MRRSREDGERPERGGDVTRGCRNQPETRAGVRGPDVKFCRFEMVSARGKKKGRGRSVGAFYRRPRHGEGVRVSGGLNRAAGRASYRCETPGWRLKRALTSGLHSLAKPGGGGGTLSGKR
jgi:hypothetical protein